MNRRSFFTLVGASLVVPFLPKLKADTPKGEMILGGIGWTTSPNPFIPNYHGVSDPGHEHRWHYCEVCRGDCRGHHHNITDPGHQHILFDPGYTLAPCDYMGRDVKWHNA